MKRTWVLVGASITVLALVWWMAVVQDRTSARGASEPLTALEAPTSVPASVAPTTLIELVLLPDGRVRAIPGSIRIGLAHVSADNAAAAPTGSEAPQAGPSSYDELATIARWVSAPAQLLPDGRARIGPLRLPRADRYILHGRGEDGLRFYVAAFTPNAIPAAVRPMVSAGIRVHVDSEETRVLLRRVAPSTPAAVWQRLQEHEAPRLLEAFNEQPLAVENGQVLAPLSPGSIEVVLEVRGVEAERRQVSLSAGRIVDVRFDPMSQAVAHAVSMDLELEFVKQGSGEPVQGLEVSWISGRLQQARTTDARGRITFKNLDRQEVHQFTLASELPVGRLPEWPELRPLQIMPDELARNDEPDRIVRHRVELVPLRWLIARVPPEGMRARSNRRSPYPIYVLQRQREGRWADTTADHFIQTPDGLAVSVAERGTYRVIAALSPWRVLESTPVQVGGSNPPTVDFLGARGSDVTVTVLRDGKALAGAPVHVIGPVGNLPPELLKADANGRVTPASTTVPKVRVEVPGSDQIEVWLSAPQAVADFVSQRSE